MKRFLIRLKGITPLLHHRMHEDDIFSLLGDKSKKKKTKEVLEPREIAARHVYQTKDGDFCIPLGYVCGAFKSVASDYKQTNSIRKSVKSIVGGVFRPETEDAILIDSDSVPIKNWEVDIRKGRKSGIASSCVVV